MPRAETLLEMAERHVREGAKLIAHQRALIVRMTERGQTTDEAMLLLQQLQEAQLQHTEHLKRLRHS
jgi:hypothetical protein